MKKLIFLVIGIVILLSLVGCTAADVASYNLSKSADSFEVNRRIVFYNGINGDYILLIEGFCSLGNNDVSGELTVTCKVGEGLYKKHFLGLSDNVTYFAEQRDPVTASPYYYRVIFRPSVIVPDIDVQVP